MPHKSTKFSENATGSSKVIDLGASRKCIHNFLLVINSGLSPTVFMILTHLARKYLVFPPPLFDAP